MILALGSTWLCDWTWSNFNSPYASPLDVLVFPGTLIGTVVCIVGVLGSFKDLRGGALLSVSVNLLLLVGVSIPFVASQTSMHQCVFVLVIWMAGATLGIFAMLVRGLILTWRDRRARTP